ncbi:carboxylating nicotinate-nucleotide diphosphorylase [Bacillaceae bacterium SIJ1]|uniref:carboxylating nicotinate-nucleotide diphosphorylase n=1 Tax=Litoribacterium kuwaitense TaxID=1398745 RepID=UPI0013ED878C|nr:carboxylating nicotinate-nucleotide diphosphorylase [Litoribacterium kuwaitense]NGP46902.1 carboxylating nicotinate-nucleotide diphosphorylase [Litoribacterium kuwaitense]
MQTIRLRRMLEHFLDEDIGHGDITSQPVAQDLYGKGQWIAKEEGIFSGKDMVAILPMLSRSQDVHVELHIAEGESFQAGDLLGTIEGPMLFLLETERVVLNLLQRMCGIATMTRQAVNELEGSNTRICDTRKTTPGLRMLEKHAVVCGGGVNQRFGLSDGALIKDNHIALAGSIKKAVAAVRKSCGHLTPIQVEVETYEEYQQALEEQTSIQSILFDNLSPAVLKEWINECPVHLQTEASGGITIDTLKDYGSTGVNFISLGQLTHSSRSIDISFNIEGGRKYA